MCLQLSRHVRIPLADRIGCGRGKRGPQRIGCVVRGLQRHLDGVSTQGDRGVMRLVEQNRLTGAGGTGDHRDIGRFGDEVACDEIVVLYPEYLIDQAGPVDQCRDRGDRAREYGPRTRGRP